MFTGIIKDVGELVAIGQQADPVLTIATGLQLSDMAIGASVACNGVCLTAIAVQHNQFQVQVSAETRARTTLGAWREGERINLERSLRAGDEMGGHIVSGHIDGTATVSERRSDGDSWRFQFSVPTELRRYLAPKGSVAINGVSLTVNEVRADDFGVNIIPHTLGATNFGFLQVAMSVNLEVDMLARYLDRLLSQRGM